MSSATVQFVNSLQGNFGPVEMKDNSPFLSAGNFGKEGSPKFYYLDAPSKWELYHTARDTEIGFRLTYGLAADIWNNKFGIVFPNSKYSQEELQEINNKIRQHLTDIRFYPEMEKATGFDAEQGEAILLEYRKGDGLEGSEKLKTAPNLKNEIIRVEAISAMDYTIPYTGKFGEASQYNISFWKEGEGKPMYVVHKERATRLKLRDINYDQYQGQALLKSCFSSIQILLNINRSASEAAFRWGTGIPAIFTKGINKKQMGDVKAQIGNPTEQSWMILPSEYIKEIQMLGLGGGAMLDLNSLADLVINQIVAASEIPRPILMGEVAGIIYGSEVNERSYFAVLDKLHTKLEPFIRDFFKKDPFITKLIGDKYFEIDWGLRQVMTKLEEVEYKMKLLQNATTMMNFAVMDEIREVAQLPPLSEVMDDKACQFFYGPEINVEVLGKMIPNLGQWRQAAAREIIETPEERKAENLSENMTNQVIEQTTKENGLSTKTGNPLHDPKAELQRRELKVARQQGARDAHIALIDEMANELQELRRNVSLNKIQEESGVQKRTFNNLQAYLEKMRSEKKE